jgi:hypothetical protein
MPATSVTTAGSFGDTPPPASPFPPVATVPTQEGAASPGVV